MSSIPLPALNVRTPQQPQLPDYSGNFSGLLQLQNMLQNGQLQRQEMQQQIEGGKIDNEIRQNSLQDATTLRQLSPQFMTKGPDGKPGYDYEGLFSKAASQGVNPQTISTLRKSIADSTLATANATEKERTNLAGINSDAFNHLEGLRGAQDPAMRQQIWDNARQWLEPHAGKLNVDMSKLPEQAPDDNALSLYEASLGMHAQQLADASTRANTRKAQADARALDFKIVNGTLYDISGEQAKPALQGQLDPQAWMSVIDSVAPPTQNRLLNGRTKAEVGFYLNKGNTDAAEKAVTRAAEQVGAIEKETDPRVLQGKVAVATAEGQARARIEAEIARGSNAALAQVPPHLIGPASAAATKAGEEYAQAQSVTQRLNEMMDAARHGNVVSYQLLPQEGALQVVTSQGVHRINMAEIQNYGGGSLWQNMEGHLGKALTGKSIPESVLKDMTQMQAIQDRGSKAKYQNSLKTINQTYGAGFEPVEMDSTAPGAPQQQPQQSRGQQQPPRVKSYSQTATGPGGVKIGSDDGKNWYYLKTGEVYR